MNNVTDFSLKNLCLKAIVNDCDRRDIDITSDIVIKNTVSSELFLSLRQLQNSAASVTVRSLTNNNLILFESECFELDTPLYILMSRVSNKVGFFFESISLGNQSYGIIAVERTSSLLDHGVKPSENVDVYFEISGVVPGRDPLKELGVSE